MMTESDLAAATHEGLHGAAAQLLGLRVDELSIDRHARDMEGFGRCATSFRESDARTAAEKAAARAQVALVAVLVAPGRGSQSDSDVAHAYEYAALAGCRGAPEAELWVQRQSDAAQRLAATEILRRLADDLSYELLANRALDADAVDRIARGTPGAVSMGLAAMGTRAS